MGLSFLIINICIYLVWHYLSRLKRSRWQVLSHIFTLKQMLEFLRQFVDRNYRLKSEVCLPVDGGNIRIRTPIGQQCDWKGYKAVRLHNKRAIAASFN